MKKNYFKHLLSLLVVAICASCNVDPNYDLSNIDDSNLGLGGDNTEIEMKVVTLKLDVESLFSDFGTSYTSLDSRASSITSAEIVEIINAVASFLPSVLEGDYEDGLDIELLGSNENDYTTNLVEIFFEEIEEDADKRLSLCDFLLEESSRYQDLINALDDAIVSDIASLSAAQLSAEIYALLIDSANAADIANIKASVIDIIIDYAETIETNYNIEESIDSINLDDSVYDIIGSNLEGASNYIRILTNLTTNLPLTIEVSPKIQYLSNWIYIPKYEDKDSNTIDGYIDSIDMLESILSNLVISADISLTKFTIPEGGFSLSGMYIDVELIIVKGGYISL